MSLSRHITPYDVDKLIERALRDQNPPHRVGNGKYIFVIETGVGKLYHIGIKLIVQVKHDDENGQWVPVSLRDKPYKWWFIKIRNQKSNDIPLANISLASMKYPNKIRLVMPSSVKNHEKQKRKVEKLRKDRHRNERFGLDMKDGVYSITGGRMSKRNSP